MDEAALETFFAEKNVTLVGCHCERNSNGRLAGFAYIQVRDAKIANTTVASADNNSSDGEWHLMDRQVRVSLFDAEALQRRQNKKKKKKKKKKKTKNAKKITRFI